MRRVLSIGFNYLLLSLGALCIALSVDLFLVPNDVVTGGVTGAAILLRTLFGTPVGLMTFLLNLPLFALGWRYLGGVVFFARTLYATALMSFLIDALAPIVAPYAVREPLLYVFYGGLLDGVGVGLTFRAGGTTGGTDILARLLQRWRGVRPGQGLLALNVGVFALAGWLYGATPVLFALLVAYIGARAVDIVVEGFSYSRSAIIISQKPGEIRATVLQELQRGITVFEGEGGYTQASRTVLFCVIAQSEESALRTLIQRIDPDAFVVITDVSDVFGEGFKPRQR